MNVCLHLPSYSVWYTAIHNSELWYELKKSLNSSASLHVTVPVPTADSFLSVSVGHCIHLKKKYKVSNADTDCLPKTILQEKQGLGTLAQLMNNRKPEICLMLMTVTKSNPTLRSRRLKTSLPQPAPTSLMHQARKTAELGLASSSLSSPPSVVATGYGWAKCLRAPSGLAFASAGASEEMKLSLSPLLTFQIWLETGQQVEKLFRK